MSVKKAVFEIILQCTRRCASILPWRVVGWLTDLTAQASFVLRAEQWRAHLPSDLVARFEAYDGETQFRPSYRRSWTPWSSEVVREVEIPGMISHEECQYYQFLARYYSGFGEVVELGPWMGKSTHYLANGLSQNPNFNGKRMVVVDDFVWRSSWMDPLVPESMRMPNYSNFQKQFSHFVEDVSDFIRVQRRRIAIYDGNDKIQPLTWARKPIEFMIADCGRTFAANEAWYQLFRPYFVPGKTIVVLQDWGTHREIPSKPYNQLFEFVRSKASELIMVHELKQGGIGSFLFMG